jgi:hypothetical protein
VIRLIGAIWCAVWWGVGKGYWGIGMVYWGIGMVYWGVGMVDWGVGMVYWRRARVCSLERVLLAEGELRRVFEESRVLEIGFEESVVLNFAWGDGSKLAGEQICLGANFNLFRQKYLVEDNNLISDKHEFTE